MLGTTELVVFELYSMLPIKFFSETSQFTLYIYNESLKDDWLTRIAYRTVFQSLLNQALF